MNIINNTSDIFTCKQCGDCCKGYGGTFVSGDDIKKIIAYTKIDSATFQKDYCQASGSKTVLAQGKNGYCVFWDGKCSIHPVKPRMCRAWPFIESVLIDIKNWRIMAALCRGIRADASENLVRECIKQKINNDWNI